LAVTIWKCLNSGRAKYFLADVDNEKEKHFFRRLVISNNRGGRGGLDPAVKGEWQTLNQFDGQIDLEETRIDPFDIEESTGLQRYWALQRLKEN